MNNIFRKLTSRKLWVAVAGVATGVALMLGADGNEINTVTGSVTALISAIVYVITEGKVDAAKALPTKGAADDTAAAEKGEVEL